MPHFNFYINDNERIDLVSFILSRGTEIYVDKLYCDVNVTPIKSIEDFLDNLESGYVRFFLVDSSFKREWFDFLEIDYEDKIKYKISQRVGGPYIDLVFYLGFYEGSEVHYKRSEIDYYNKFIHCNSYDEFQATDELKVYYKELVKFVKKKYEVIKNNKKHWISKEVLKELLSLAGASILLVPK